MPPLSTLLGSIILGLGLLAIDVVARAITSSLVRFDPKTEALVKPLYPVSYEQWVKNLTVDEPKPVLVPSGFRPQLGEREREDPKQAIGRLEEITRAVDAAEKERDRRVAALEQEISRRQLEHRELWIPRGVLLSLLPIYLIYAYALYNVRRTLSLTQAADSIASTTISMLQVLAMVLVAYLMLRFALAWAKPEDGKDQISKDVRIFLLSTLISVTLIPTIFGEPITLMDLFQGFAFGIVAETAAALLVNVELFKTLKKARDKFGNLDFGDARTRPLKHRDALHSQFEAAEVEST